jgi:hypothetical protein
MVKLKTHSVRMCFFVEGIFLFDIYFSSSSVKGDSFCCCVIFSDNIE